METNLFGFDKAFNNLQFTTLQYNIRTHDIIFKLILDSFLVPYLYHVIDKYIIIILEDLLKKYICLKEEINNYLGLVLWSQNYI